MITQTCVEKMGLTVARVSRFCIQLAHHQKVKCLGVVKSLEIEAYAVKSVVDFHVMPAGLGAYPIILGRPWLRAVNAIQNWKHGTISLCGSTGEKKVFDMSSQKPLNDWYEGGEESSSEDSSTVSEVDTDDTSSSDEDVDVAFLLMDKDFEHTRTIALTSKIEDKFEGPYEVIEELMQPKVELQQKKELVAKMVSTDLSTMEREKYLGMLSKFPNLFITSYEEIRGFKGEELHIELRDGAKPVHQRLRRMSQE